MATYVRTSQNYTQSKLEVKQKRGLPMTQDIYKKRKNYTIHVCFTHGANVRPSSHYTTLQFPSKRSSKHMLHNCQHPVVFSWWSALEIFQSHQQTINFVFVQSISRKSTTSNRGSNTRYFGKMPLHWRLVHSIVDTYMDINENSEDYHRRPTFPELLMTKQVVTQGTTVNDVYSGKNGQALEVRYSGRFLYT